MLLSYFKSYFTYLNSSEVLDLSSPQLMLQMEYKMQSVRQN